MPQAPHDPWLEGFTSVIFFASAATWVFLIAKWQRDGRLLGDALRRPVPWGPGATILAIAIAALTVLSGISIDQTTQPLPTRDSSEALSQLLAQLLPVIFLPGGFLVAVAILSRAVPSDLGLPMSGRELARDIWLGVVTCLAAVIPVFSMLIVLQILFNIKDVSHHPLVETVNRSGGMDVLLLATVGTVLVAPVFEETTFRLLLQGWLEKAFNDEARMTNDECPTDGSSSVNRHSSFVRDWLPILISSTVFAAAHFGYGPEPVPIFVLALFLGYVYQRTHRIVPCMVAHGLFNLLSMVALWRMVLGAR